MHCAAYKCVPLGINVVNTGRNKFPDAPPSFSPGHLQLPRGQPARDGSKNRCMWLFLCSAF